MKLDYCSCENASAAKKKNSLSLLFYTYSASLRRAMGISRSMLNLNYKRGHHVHSVFSLPVVEAASVRARGEIRALYNLNRSPYNPEITRGQLHICNLAGTDVTCSHVIFYLRVEWESPLGALRYTYIYIYVGKTTTTAQRWNML